MSDQVIVLSESRLKEIIESSVAAAIAANQLPTPNKDNKPKVLLSRLEVKEMLHTTYPTLQKYTDQGLLKCVYFGRKVLYPEEELNLALPQVRTIQSKRKRKLTPA